MECENLQDLRERLRVKLWNQTGLDIWLTDMFLAVSKKDDYYKDRIIITEIFDELGRLTNTKPQ